MTAKMGKWQVSLFRNHLSDDFDPDLDEDRDPENVVVDARSAEEALDQAEAEYLSEGSEFVRMGFPKMIERSGVRELSLAEPA